MRRRCSGTLILVAFCACLLAGAVSGCTSSSGASSSNPALYPGNPLAPAKEASAAAGSANQKATETQDQLKDLTGGNK